MHELKLVKPNMDYATQIMEIKKEIIAAGDKDAFAGCGNLKVCDKAADWIKSVEDLSSEKTCPRNRVVSDTYLAIRCLDNKVVGICDLRHNLDNPVLSLWGGHIGYTVRPSERRKGYAKEMLRLNLLNAKTLGLAKVMITCTDCNPASEKTIVYNGGVYEKTVTVENENIKRYWITLETEGTTLLV